MCVVQSCRLYELYYTRVKGNRCVVRVSTYNFLTVVQTVVECVPLTTLSGRYTHLKVSPKIMQGIAKFRADFARRCSKGGSLFPRRSGLYCWLAVATESFQTEQPLLFGAECKLYFRHQDGGGGGVVVGFRLLGVQKHSSLFGGRRLVDFRRH